MPIEDQQRRMDAAYEAATRMLRVFFRQPEHWRGVVREYGLFDNTANHVWIVRAEAHLLNAALDEFEVYARTRLVAPNVSRRLLDACELIKCVPDVDFLTHVGETETCPHEIVRTINWKYDVYVRFEMRVAGARQFYCIDVVLQHRPRNSLEVDTDTAATAPSRLPVTAHVHTEGLGYDDVVDVLGGEYLRVLRDVLSGARGTAQAKLVRLANSALAARSVRCTHCAVSPAFLCGACAYVRYCSLECQRAGYTLHRDACPRLGNIMKHLESITAGAAAPATPADIDDG